MGLAALLPSGDIVAFAAGEVQSREERSGKIPGDIYRGHIKWGFFRRCQYLVCGYVSFPGASLDGECRCGTLLWIG